MSGEIKIKEKLTPRGARLPDRQWLKMEQIAKEETERTGESVTTSDVIRHAVDFFLKNIS